MQLPVSIITIGGVPHSGKSTVAKRLVELTGYTRIDAGSILRGWCKLKEYNPQGLTFQEWYATLDPAIDEKVDAEMRRVAQEQPGTILEGRMAFHWSTPLPKFKVYIDADPKISGERVYRQKRADAEARKEECCYASAEEATRNGEERKMLEKKRYLELYKVNIHDLTHYDQIIDSSRLSVDEVATKILTAAKQFTRAEKQYRASSIK